ncbi:VirD4-like conjugal transfer protein, CD1115 family [Alicyclobacillus ferrooxydans]|uniref:Conjugal transfer protein TraG n=1 Tax=Alicyclobacillus ferrooxydans TaxID=471514 RepID=A0A0P9EIP9_9BACL|nr:type IV secretory system conjugative DNA transfer family protein [Alicyclobacillus ferrooxydans]KPV42702.1 hypothetical protein AN477_16365 [Alicyclobacillus ferrooxydans]
MHEQRIKVRYTVSAILTLIIYGLTATAAGMLTEFIQHLRHLTSRTLLLIKVHALHGAYLLWPFTHQSPITWMGVGVTVAFAIWDNWKTYTVFRNSRRQYEVRDRYAAYGTSRWQTRDEAKTFYERDNKGYLLGDWSRTAYAPLPDAAFDDPRSGSYDVHPWTSDLNHQYIVFGPPGSDKTTGFILPNIFHAAQQGISMVVTDPKGELYDLTASYLRERNYRVVVLDYIHFRYGARLNLLNYVYDEAQYAEIASMYLESTRNEGDKKDFWEGKAQELFTSLIGFVKQAFGDAGTLTDVYRLIPMITDPDSLLNLYNKHGVGGAAKDLLRSILAMAKSENTLGNIAGTLSEKLQLFTLSNVRAQTSTSDFELDTIGDVPTIVYVWMSDSQNTYAPLVTAFWTVFFNALYERARKNGHKLPIPVLPLIDEMGNIGKIAGFLTKLTTMRSRRIYPMMIWHSLPQIKLVYGEKYAEAMLGACDTKIVLGCGDLETAEYMSKMIGDTTIETQSKRGSRTVTAEPQNTTQQYAMRRLMQAPEIMRLSPTDVLVWQRKRHPLILKKVKYRYWEESICPTASLDELPQYSLDETNISHVPELPLHPETEETVNTEHELLSEDAGELLDDSLEELDEPIAVPVNTGVANAEAFWEEEHE